MVLIANGIKSSDTGWKKLKPIKGILRAEMRLMKPKAVRAYTDADDASGQITGLLKDSRNIFGILSHRLSHLGIFIKRIKLWRLSVKRLLTAL